MKKQYKTPQEEFWAGDFGDDYINRNEGDKLLASNLNFFNNACKLTNNLKSVIEFGANIGMNLKAFKLLFPTINIEGVEINKKAHEQLSTNIGHDNAHLSSIFDFDSKNKFDITLIKGVLIHINPNELQKVYQKLYDLSNNYILICEYYNPSPVAISYRGHKDRLFKRDFAGEFLDKFKNTKLIDYGFSYHRDVKFPQDDITWFLISKS